MNPIHDPAMPPSASSHKQNPAHSQSQYSSNARSAMTSSPPSTIPAASHGTPALNPRSCVICRRRKVRCNKQYPCSNCSKAKVPCIFPAPERAKRRPRKPPDGELLARLRRLEGVIQGMGMSVEDELASAGGEGTSPVLETPSRQGSYTSAMRNVMGQGEVTASPDGSTNGDLGTEFSRLVVSEGKSRYVNNRFWASMSSEVEDLKGILDESSDEETNDFPSPSTDLSSPPPEGAYFFQYSSIATDLQPLHPPTDQIRQYWSVYKDYIDPVLKMTHVPSMEKQMQAAMHNPSKTSKPMEAFLFVVYYSAVTALTTEDCQMRFGDSREALVRRFKFGVEQSLARANFLLSEELLVLQTFITFLICLKSHEDGRIIWSMCGIIVRTAVSMGLHRDGSHFNLSPFEIEMRRRTWWQLVVLESRSAQDMGIEPMVLRLANDTQLPCNVNDEELTPSMARLPQSRKGITDMTFCILRYDLQETVYKLWNPTASLQQKEAWITDCHSHLEQDYFNHCDMTKPLDWTICTVAKLIMARQFLLLYHPYIKTLQQGTIDRLFVTALDTIEFALRLENERKLVKWGWLFKTYNQWHALAFLLSELTRRTKGPMVQRAWRAVNSTLAEFKQNNHDHHKRGQLWRPLVKLLQTARQARERELALEGQQHQNLQLSPEMDQMMAPQLSVNPPDITGVAVAAASNTAMNSSSGGNIGKQPQGSTGMQMDPDQALDPLSDSMLQRSISNRSNNFVDSQYLFDNTSNNVPITSQFFANTPGLWQNNNAAGVGLAGNWFNSWSSDENLAPEFDPTNLQGFNMQQQAMGQDPMVGGSDLQGVTQFTDWDEVMKDFESASGQPSAGQWNNKPTLMGEAWL